MRVHPLPFVSLALACSLGISIYLLAQFLQVRADLAETNRRLQKIEAAVQKRESADPLEARECVELGTGASPDNPCYTTLRRLAQTPQQFHRTWVVVEGIYASGFEHSAVYPIPSEPMEASKSLDKHEALWVQLGLPNTQNRPVITVMGRFVRGPAGHLGDYFGELVDAKMVRSNVDVAKGVTK